LSDYRLSRRADRDIEGIIRFSAGRWGWSQAEAYIGSLHQAFDMVARFPEIGRRVDHIRPGYLRFEHASHSIFYRIVPDGVLIIRVLHFRMKPEGRL
jgi:toxin ParE1/3/4